MKITLFIRIYFRNWINFVYIYIGITTKEASLENIGNQVDDDIMRFLDNFPLGVPVPDWCDDQQNTSNGQSFECDQIQLSSKSSSWRFGIADSEFEVYRFLIQQF